ncbi:hypothetical protein [Chitinilyticum litopenaei]|uniref:hypothetical protein n=1 Tax=Chitinilyticum litopenaei TaxID=1121276 RepID=UPI0003F765CD|nr:hypothetical protein [Chitinilyticum litopenaei]
MLRQFGFALLVIVIGLLLAGATALLIPEAETGKAWSQLLVLVVPLALCVLLMRYLPLQLEAKFLCFIVLALFLLAARGYYDDYARAGPDSFRQHLDWLL